MWKDIRFAFRILLQSPGFSTIVILTLAVGIGLTTALFGVINGVLIRPLPFKQPDKLMILWEISRRGDNYSVAYQNFQDWREQNSTFESMAASRLDTLNVTARGQAERTRTRMVSHNFLSTLGIQPFLGRDFAANEDKPNTAQVALLSYKFWKTTFHEDPKILGQAIQANDRPVTVIGVLPANFHFFTNVDLLLLLGPNSDQWPKRDSHPGIYVFGRLRPDVTAEAAQADMDQIAAKLEKQYPKTNSGNGVFMKKLEQEITGDVRPTLWLLFGAVIFVMLIGCANVANMMLARGVKRQKEISIRMALGAGRANVVRQFLIESILLSLAGGIAGVILASNAIDLLLWLRPANLPRLQDIKLDWIVLGFSFCVSTLSGIFFGLLPALRSSRVDLSESMKQSGSSTSAPYSSHNLRNALVISQVTFSLLLMIGAGLMIKSILTILKSNPGFSTDHLLTVELSLSPDRYQGHKVLEYLDEAERRIRMLPGVQSTAYANGLPLAGANEGQFWVEGQPKPDPGKFPRVVQYIVSPGYFDTLKIPLVQGRYLGISDRSGQPWKVVIDEALAKKYFGNVNPLGKSLRMDEEFPPFEIVGVVRHVKHYGLDVVAPVDAQLYISIPQLPDQYLSRVADNLHLLIRTNNDPINIAASVRRELRTIDPEQPISATQTMNQMVADSLAARRFSMLLLSIFALVALFLAAAGIYGVLSYTVVQRSKEIGIRMAVGAGKVDVLKLVLAKGMRLIVTGLLLGIAASLALSKFLATQLYAVKPTDPSTFVLISALLCLVGLAATYLPASRAMRVDPLSVLKYE